MGSCVSSSHTNNSSAPNSAVALISKPDTTSAINKDVITSETINSNPPIDSGRRDSGSKDEMIFFDSRGWLDSDCDDDFMSVAAEFTPSRGSTPVHHKFCDQTPHQEVQSPTDNKKRLVELFKETQDKEEDEEDYVAEGKARTCLWLRTPVSSSAPATPNERPLQLKRPHGGCVPRLVSCSSFTDRPRKLMTHTPIHVHR